MRKQQSQQLLRKLRTARMIQVPNIYVAYWNTKLDTYAGTTCTKIEGASGSTELLFAMHPNLLSLFVCVCVCVPIAIQCGSDSRDAGAIANMYNQNGGTHPFAYRIWAALADRPSDSPYHWPARPKLIYNDDADGGGSDGGGGSGKGCEK